jgi:glycosyltransferase involved in cell wall biosynthesis
LHIGFLLSGSLDNVTGGYIYDRQLVLYLRQKGHRVDLLHIPGRTYLDRLSQNPILGLSRKLSRQSFDVLLQDELDHPALIFLNRRLKNEARYPVVSIVHHLRSSEFRPRWQNDLYRTLEKSYLNSVDGFVFNSHTTAQTVEGLIGQGRPAVIAYPCGNRFSHQINETIVEQRSSATGPLKVIFVGSIIQRKALHVLLSALKDLPGDNFLLTIIGDASVDKGYVKRMRNQIHKNSMEGRVKIEGKVNDADLAARLVENQVLVVPSEYEGFGIVYLEGMGYGLPAIATTSGGAKEIITHRRNGFLISPGDVLSLASYLTELHENRQLLAVMSGNAYKRYREHPTWQTTGENILNYLQSLCCNKVVKQ